MSRLRVLSLRDNKMTSLSESTFSSIKPTISRLDVDGSYLLLIINKSHIIIKILKDTLEHQLPC